MASPGIPPAETSFSRQIAQERVSEMAGFHQEPSDTALEAIGRKYGLSVSLADLRAVQAALSFFDSWMLILYAIKIPIFLKVSPAIVCDACT